MGVFFSLCVIALESNKTFHMMTTNNSKKSSTVKIVAVATLFLASAVPSMSQSAKPHDESLRQQWSVMAGASANSSTEDVFKTKAGFHVGVGYDLPVKGNFTVQPRLLFSYSQQEVESRYYSSNYNSSQASPSGYSLPGYKYDKFSLTLPVLATYRFDLGHSWGARVNAGPYLQYDMFGHERQAVSNAQGEVSYSDNGWWHQPTGDRFSWGLMGGVAIERGKWSVEVSHKYSFSKNSLYFDMGHEKAWMVGVGYKF